MVSNLGQMPYESEFGKLKLEAVWGPTALQGLEGEQNVGVATTNGAIRLLHASYSLIPHLLDRSSYYTGQSLTLDGGLTAQRPYVTQSTSDKLVQNALDEKWRVGPVAPSMADDLNYR